MNYVQRHGVGRNQHHQEHQNQQAQQPPPVDPQNQVQGNRLQANNIQGNHVDQNNINHGGGGEAIGHGGLLANGRDHAEERRRRAEAIVAELLARERQRLQQELPPYFTYQHRTDVHSMARTFKYTIIGFILFENFISIWLLCLVLLEQTDSQRKQGE